MGFIVEDSYWAEVAILVLTILYLIYSYLTGTYDYWAKKGVPEVKTKEPLFGALRKAIFLKRQFALHFHDLYNELEGHKFGGYFDMRNPTLLVRDPGLVKQMLVKDFAYFTDNIGHVSEKNDPMFAFNIFSMKGDKWKYVRSKLSPAFATGKIRAMFPLILEVCEELKKNLQRKIDSAEDKGQFEAHALAADYTTDVVGSCAFGVKCDSLINPDNVFRKMGQNLVSPESLWRQIEVLFAFTLPKVAEIFKFKFVSKQLEDFFQDLVKKAFAFREKHPEFIRNDFINLLMQLKKLGKVIEVDGDEKVEFNPKLDKEASDAGKIEFNDTVLTAQAVGFFIDGFETSSKALSFALHECARNPDLQIKLREELQNSLEPNDGKIDYDCIRDCAYLEHFLQETLRMYTVAGFLRRECTKPYTIPGTDVRLEKGNYIMISSYGMHQNPEFYPDPEVFDPDRFTEEAKKTRPPYTYLPFSEGPRQCIGFRFAQAQIKAALATIVLNFEIKQSPKTQHPIVFDDANLLLHAKHGLHLKIAPL